MGTKVTDQFVDEVVHRLSSLDQQDDSPGLLQFGHHVFQRLGSDHLGALGLVLQKVVHLGHGSVERADLLGGFRGDWVRKQQGSTGDQLLLLPSLSLEVRSRKNASQDPYHKTVVVHVHDEVLAHHGQTDECDVCSVGRRAMMAVTERQEHLSTLHHFLLLLF